MPSWCKILSGKKLQISKDGSCQVSCQRMWERVGTSRSDLKSTISKSYSLSNSKIRDQGAAAGQRDITNNGRFWWLRAGRWEQRRERVAVRDSILQAQGYKEDKKEDTLHQFIMDRLHHPLCNKAYLRFLLLIKNHHTWCQTLLLLIIVDSSSSQVRIKHKLF